jgi:hypothetical protein
VLTSAISILQSGSVLSDKGVFSAELLYCSHEFHRSCVTDYASHAILSDGRWCVRCPSSNCNYRLYHTDVKELCGQSSPALTRCAAAQLRCPRAQR